VVVLERNQGNVWAEYFLADRPHARPMLLPVHERRQETADGVFHISHCSAFEQDLRAFLASQLVVRQHLLDRALVDYRSGETTGIQGVADAQPLRRVDELLGVAIEDRFRNEDSTRADAALAAGLEGADDPGGH